MRLDVVLRTCQRPDISKSREHTRFCGDDRVAMLDRCIRSLIATINHSQNDVRLTVLDDHSETAWLTWLQQQLAQCNKPVELVALSVTGNNQTTLAQIEWAQRMPELVYVIEDDYLHETVAIDSMTTAFTVLEGRAGMSTVVFPFDDPQRYNEGKEQPTLLLFDGLRYWRQTTKTSICLLGRSKFFRENYRVFRELAEGMPMVWEDETINTLYRDLATGRGSTMAWNPIPSLAYHLSYGGEPTSIRDGHLNWRTLWSSFD